MKDPILWVFVLVLGLLAGGLFYYQSGQERPASTPAQLGETPPVADAQPEPDAAPIRYPVPDRSVAQGAPAQSAEIQQQPAEVQGETLPSLDESDGLLQGQLARLFAGQRLDARFNLDAIVRRFVVTVDNLPGTKLPHKHLVTRAAPGRLVVIGEGELEYLGPDNFSRYTPFVQLLESANSQLMVSVYVALYPLFQQAYEEIGYPSGYFNDRLIDVIDHLLETPDIEKPIRLVRSRALYQYADARLEALSAGHKVLIRIGPDNAARIKTKLRELRSALAGVSRAKQADPPAD